MQRVLEVMESWEEGMGNGGVWTLEPTSMSDYITESGLEWKIPVKLSALPIRPPPIAQRK